MPQTLAHIALVVRDYDEAISYYTNILGFRLLARAATPEQSTRIGNQTGGRVFLFLHTDDFWRDYRALRAHQVEFVREPKDEPYGTVAVCKDLYGNLWDLIQPR